MKIIRLVEDENTVQKIIQIERGQGKLNSHKDIISRAKVLRSMSDKKQLAELERVSENTSEQVTTNNTIALPELKLELDLKQGSELNQIEKIWKTHKYESDGKVKKLNDNQVQTLLAKYIIENLKLLNAGKIIKKLPYEFVNAWVAAIKWPNITAYNPVMMAMNSEMLKDNLGLKFNNLDSSDSDWFRTFSKDESLRFYYWFNILATCLNTDLSFVDTIINSKLNPVPLIFMAKLYKLNPEYWDDLCLYDKQLIDSDNTEKRRDLHVQVEAGNQSAALGLLSKDTNFKSNKRKTSLQSIAHTVANLNKEEKTELDKMLKDITEDENKSTK